MALQKSKTLLDGTSGNYWHILTFYLDVKTRKCVVNMGLWIDASHYSTSNPLNYKKTVSFTFAPGDFSAGITPTYVYTQILNFANSMVPPLGGSPGDPLVNADSDLAGATVVS